MNYSAQHVSHPQHRVEKLVTFLGSKSRAMEENKILQLLYDVIKMILAY